MECQIFQGNSLNSNTSCTYLRINQYKTYKALHGKDMNLERKHSVI